MRYLKYQAYNIVWSFEPIPFPSSHLSPFLLKEQEQNHSQTVSSLSKQLNDTRNDLRERGKENKETQRAWRSEKEDKEREERKLRESLEERDKLIEVCPYMSAICPYMTLEKH